MPENNLPDIEQREISLVFGKTGMGKSNFLKNYLSELRRVIIIDPLDEYPGKEYDDIGAMIDYLEKENVKRDNRKNFCLRTCNIDDLEAIGEIVADGDKKDDPRAMRNITLMIEEAQLCLPPSRSDLPDSLKRIIFRGRHFGRSLIIAAQRPSIVHIAARSQWTRIVSFNLTEGGDTDWLKGVSGYGVLGETDLGDVRQLPIGEYFEITPGSCERKRAPLYIPKKEVEDKPYQGIFDLFPAFNL